MNFYPSANAVNQEQKRLISNRQSIQLENHQQFFETDSYDLGNRLPTIEEATSNYSDFQQITDRSDLQTKRSAHPKIFPEDIIETDENHKTVEKSHKQNKQEKILPPHEKTKWKCHDCHLHSLKMEELTSTYQQLLLCKADEISQYREIIFKLENKIKHFQQKVKREAQKNLFFRQQLEKVHFQFSEGQGRQQETIDYLKNRQLLLLDQLKNMNNKVFLKSIDAAKNKHSAEDLLSTENISQSLLLHKSKSKPSVLLQLQSEGFSEKGELIKAKNQNEFLKDKIRVLDLINRMVKVESLEVISI